MHLDQSKNMLKIKLKLKKLSKKKSKRYLIIRLPEIVLEIVIIKIL